MTSSLRNICLVILALMSGVTSADTVVYSADDRVFVLWGAEDAGHGNEFRIFAKECVTDPANSINPRDCEGKVESVKDQNTGKLINVSQAYISRDDLGRNLISNLYLDTADAESRDFPQAIQKLEALVQRLEKSQPAEVLAKKKDFRQKKIKLAFLKDILLEEYEALVTGNTERRELFTGVYGDGSAEALMATFMRRQIVSCEKVGKLMIQLANYPNSKPEGKYFSATGFSTGECNEKFNKMVETYKINQTKPGMLPKTFYFEKEPEILSKTHFVYSGGSRGAREQLESKGIYGFSEPVWYRNPGAWLPRSKHQKYEFSYTYAKDDADDAEMFSAKTIQNRDITYRPWVIGNAELFLYDDCVAIASGATNLWKTCSVQEVE